LLIRHGLWFVDIPRTSSSSIQVELGAQLGKPFGKKNLFEKEFATTEFVADHTSAGEIAEILGSTVWEKIFTFSLVRNPWDRALSMFHYRSIVENIPKEWTFEVFLNRWKEADASDPYFRFHGLRWSQLDYLTDETGTILVDYVGRYERRDEALRTVEKQVDGLNFQNLRLQRSAHKREGRSYREFYSERSAQTVYDMFRAEIELFGYAF
jgi:hypothetical protein